MGILRRDPKSEYVGDLHCEPAPGSLPENSI